MLLCVFLGNSENFLGDMSRENFIDCVGWCGRNVAGFSLNPTHVQEFLGDMANFYTYLKKRRIVLHDEGPREALARLVVKGKLQLMDRKGNFLSEVEKYNVYSSPDLPAKIFLNVGEKLDKLMEALRNFYADARYYREVERASFLFNGFVATGALSEDQESEEYGQSFWDYFLFDYHMLLNDKTPLQHFKHELWLEQFNKQGQRKTKALKQIEPYEAYADILEELLKTKLVIFKVLGKNEDNSYSCQDVFDNSGYSLVLPITEETDTKNTIFIGHIYYNATMVVNFVRGFKILPVAQKRMLEVGRRAKELWALRTQKQLSWENFIARNALFMCHLCVIFAAFIRLGCFNCETQVQEYAPHLLLNDKVSQAIHDFMWANSFSAYDIRLCQTMWSDFFAKTGKKVRLPEIWAAGIIRNFIDVNGVYNYAPHEVAEMCHNIPVNTVYRTSNEISSALVLEQGDPRYINEEGLLLLLLT